MNDKNNNYDKLLNLIKEKGIYKLFSYKYFISDNFEDRNPPLFYINNKYENHFNMLLYQLLLRKILKKYNLSKITSILSVSNDKEIASFNYIYQFLINKKITNYNISNFTNNFTKKVDLIYTENFNFKKIANILNKDGILIIKNNITSDNINILKKYFRLIDISNILNFTNKFIICYNYQSKFEMNNDIYQEYITQSNNEYNNLSNEINNILTKNKKNIMYHYLNKLLKIIDLNQLTISPYYRKIYYYQKWKERINIDSNKELQILEIGVYKGEMSIWFINNLLKNKNSKINLVDTWEGSVEYNEDFNKVYEEYKKNIKYSKYPEKAIENKTTSLNFLAKHILKYDKPYFDLIYIDACHDSRCVMTDAMLSWKVLKVGGYLIFDDYGWNLLKDKPDYVRPKMSIDCFLNLFRDDIQIIHKGYKVFLKKTKEYKF